MDLLLSIVNQCLLFLPLAFAICISFGSLKVVDMTLDGSFVLGGGVFAKLITLGFPIWIAFLGAIISGVLSGFMVSLIQFKQKIDPLLAGVLASFILLNGDLLLMGKPNISLLNVDTLFSNSLVVTSVSQTMVLFLVIFLLISFVFLLLQMKYGLFLRALGNNPQLFARLGKRPEFYRLLGFGLTNGLAAVSGCLTSQMNGFADIGMAAGVTLTALGAVILGHELVRAVKHVPYLRLSGELAATVIGILFYFSLLNSLLFLGVDPTYLKLIIAVLLIVFLRYSSRSSQGRRRGKA